MEHESSATPPALYRTQEGFAEPFAMVPNWVLRQFARIPASDRTTTALLYADLYGTLPWGDGMTLSALAQAARLTETEAARSVARRIRAGWVEEKGGKYRIRRDLGMPGTAPRPDGDDASSYSLMPVAVLIPVPLLEMWTRYLEEDELALILHLVNLTWRRGEIDVSATLTDLIPTPEGRQPRFDAETARRLFVRLELMQLVWRWTSSEDPDALPKYRLNRFWHQRVQEYHDAMRGSV